MVDDEILCVVCSKRHAGRAGDCQEEQPRPSSPQKTKPLGSVLERLDDAFRGQGPSGELDGRQTSAPLTTVRDAHVYEELFCVRCGWIPAGAKEHRHDA
jgi:hypothetical protein